MQPSKNYLRLTAAAVLLFATVSAHAAFDTCRDYFPNQTPPQVTGRQQLRDICFDSFAVLHSGQSKTPVFSVERLNRARLSDARDEVRTDKFYAEARLPAAERATLADYAGSGYDRGHMSPAADMPTPSAMAQSFSLANMVPQAPANNRGIWAKKIEKPTRQYAMRAQGDVFVFTGPVFSGPVSTIGPNHVWVPTHLFKLVYDQAAGRAWAYWVENKDDAQMNRPLSYADLVKMTGIEFLPGVRLKG